MLKKLIRANLDDLFLCCGVVGGVFVLLQLAIGAVMALLKPDSSLMISGVFLPITAGLLILVVTISHVGLSFVQAVQYGQTRRRALGLALGLTGFETLCSMGLAAALAALERTLAPTLWKALSGAQYLQVGPIPPRPEPGPNVPLDLAWQSTLVVEDFTLDWWWFLAIPLLCMAAGLIIGALVQRFGGKGGWIVCCLWMVYIFGQQFVSRGAFTAVFSWMLPLVGGLLVAALAWSVWSLLHASVK